MTIDISNNNPRISYSVSAGVTQSTFTVPFEFFADTDLNVYVDEVLQTITTDYTVSGGDGSTGTITMTVTGEKTVLISRDTTIERTTDFTAGVDINRAALNTQLDTLTAIGADVKDLAERAIRIKDFDPSTASLELPAASVRANKLLGFDTEGNVQAQAASDLLTGSVLGANYTKASHTGDGSTVAFSTTSSAGSKNNIQVYIDGVYQNKDTFSISGATLTFSEAPPLNSAIEFIVGNAVTSYSTDADGITYNQGGTNAQDRTLSSRLQEFVSVKDFGAIGDGATDDTSNIQAAIDATVGKTLYFPKGTYKITSTLNVVISGEVNWKAESATLVFSPATHQHKFINMSLEDGTHIIEGNLTLDVNQNANVGLYAAPVVQGTDKPSLYITGLNVLNTYRELSHNDGDGILCVGSFDRVYLDKVTVKDCGMATGAGVSGIYGIFGITLSRSGDHATDFVVMSNIWIENVFSDDSSYIDDQDGIRVFTRYGLSTGVNNPDTFSITNSKIINVRGRSIKLQTENGLINGVSLYRTSTSKGTVALSQNADIEAQTGGCTIDNVEFQYEDHVPYRALRVIQADSDVIYQSMHNITNVRGVVKGSSTPNSILLITGDATGGATQIYNVNVDNINVRSQGAFAYPVSIGGISGSQSTIVVNASNIIAQGSTAFFYSTAQPDSVTVNAINIVNRGSSVALSSGLSGSPYIINALNIKGFSDNAQYTGDLNLNGNISMPNLPTSSAGLSSGDLWNNSGVVNIV